MEYEVLKNRSYRGVISAGFGLYFSHFRLFFKASWLMALLFAIVFAALEMLFAVQLPAITATIMKQVLVQQAPVAVETAQQYLITIGGISVVLLLYVVIEAMTYGTVVNKLKEHLDTNAMTMPKGWFYICRRYMGRTLKGYLFTLIVILIPALLLSAGVLALMKYVGIASFTLMTLVVIMSLLLTALYLPLAFVFMKYVMNPGQRYFSLLTNAYATGMRHWGAIFTVGLIGGLLIGIALGICLLPANILSQAHFAAQEGFLNGDPMGMPAYINTLSVITYFLTGFVLIYLCMPMLTIAYYMYGSIETYEQEKTNKI